MSQITAIYDVIEALSITTSPAVQGVYDLSELPDTLEDGHLPCRVLLPWYGRNARSSFEFIADGTTGAIDWTIVDLLLYRRAGLGTGIKDSASALVSYAAAYVEKLRTIRGIVTATPPQSELVGASVEVGVFQYPEGGGQPYEGVAVTLRIREYLTGAPN